MATPRRTSSRSTRSRTPGRSIQSKGGEVSQWIATNVWNRDFEVRQSRGRVVFTMRGTERDARKAMRDLAKREVAKARRSGESLYDRLKRAGVIGSVDSGIGDLSTNKAHMKGFGVD